MSNVLNPLIPNPSVVLREEFDDWAILFDPDTGNAFGLNPLGVLVWKSLLDSKEMGAIIQAIHHAALDVPQDVEDHIRSFMKSAVDLGLAAYKATEDA